MQQAHAPAQIRAGGAAVSDPILCIFQEWPKTVGYFVSGGNVRIAWLNKPNVWQRWWYRVLLGWRWEDA
jgi:hypothetical protein